MMKWFSLFFGISISAFAQENEYFKNIHQNDLGIRTSISQDLFSLEIGELIYLPNSPNSLNFGVTHPKVPFEIGFGFDLSSNNTSPNHSPTKKFDLQFHTYGKKYVMDLFFQDYKGFYSNTDLPLSEVNHHNLSMFMIGAFGQYVFNNNKFSYDASFGKNKKQLKSAGTFLAGANIYYLRLKSEKPIAGKMKNITMKLFGVNGGYSFNYPFSKNWITNISVNIGLNFTDKLSLKHSSLARISLYHVGENITYGISGVGNDLYLNEVNKESSDKVHSGKMNFDFIYHFKLKNKK